MGSDESDILSELRKPNLLDTRPGAVCGARGKPKLIDLRVGNNVSIRQSWRSPHAGHLGVVTTIEPDDEYGAYIIEFEDGLHFRYHRHELEPAGAGTSDFYRRAVGKLHGFIRLLVRRHA